MLVAIGAIAIFSVFALDIIVNIQKNMLRLKNAILLDIELSHVSAQLHSFVATPTIIQTVQLSDPLTEISMNSTSSTNIIFYTVSATRLDYNRTIKILQVLQ
ncbi:MAG: hypothetical protein PWQ20_1588 [Thermotogaceae bacterium]|nr:hypothetical protein [Thermotogaceae bacterium]MDN5338518.1 hypothetical protein [Thermotogaceae bacterium]